MAQLYANENFPLPLVEELRRLGHNVLTTLADARGNEDVPRSVRLFDLLGIADEADLMPPAFWRAPPERAWQSDVPIGAKAGGQPLYLDLYEQMHGPHGIIAGATGAGKSVLLQGIIAALAITHSPKQL